VPIIEALDPGLVDQCEAAFRLDAPTACRYDLMEMRILPVVGYAQARLELGKRDRLEGRRLCEFE
jgi:hypothetical protein